MSPTKTKNGGTTTTTTTTTAAAAAVADESSLGCEPLKGLPPSITKQGWFTEQEDLWPGQRFSLALEGLSTTSKSILFHERSQYQDILVFKSAQYGNVLVLDGVLQVTEKDEFAFHEPMVHIPLFTHPNPQTICIVGGGDGGCLREILRHDSVRRVVLVEIDPRVIYVTKTYFNKRPPPFKLKNNATNTTNGPTTTTSPPTTAAGNHNNAYYYHPESVAAGFDDPRVEIVHQDAAVYLKNQPPELFDIILSDTSDPVGPAEPLFQPEFYESMHRALKPQGIVCVQALCLWIHLDLISELVAGCAHIFDTSEYASTMVPSYPCGQIGFILACKDRIHSCRRPIPRPAQYAANQEDILSQLQWYSFAQHSAAFTLPPFFEKFLTQKYQDDPYEDDEDEEDDEDFWALWGGGGEEQKSCVPQCSPCFKSWFARRNSSSLIQSPDNDDDDENNGIGPPEDDDENQSGTIGTEKSLD